MRACNLIGQRFGRLTVIARAENSKDGKTRWICKCDCGRIKERPIGSHDLRSGKVRSCGCIYKESNKGRGLKHGMYGTRLYICWASMKQRCKQDPHYADISVCKQWETFEPFMKWSLANGYRDDLTLDRIDNSGNYTPENCRWASYQQQENNRRNNRIVTVRGEQKTVADWARYGSVPYATLLRRINSGWPECDLFIPPDLANAKKRKENRSA